MNEAKASTLAANVRAYLEPGGVLFGSTILGRGIAHTRLGRRVVGAVARFAARA